MAKSWLDGVLDDISDFADDALDTIKDYGKAVVKHKFNTTEKFAKSEPQNVIAGRPGQSISNAPEAKKQFLGMSAMELAIVAAGAVGVIWLLKK